MIAQPKCSLRRCVHFKGVVQPDKTEASERCVCKAFPKGIPNEIAYGADEHTSVHSGQTGDFVFTADKDAPMRGNRFKVLGV